jgi:GTP cyclohydrolase I
VADEKSLVEQVADHISAISSLLGIKVTESNKDTPNRVAKMYCNELFRNREGANLSELDSKMKLFPNEGVHEPVVVSDIPFWSTCDHHWLPFGGTVTVSYIPGDSIIGLSKIPRVVKYFSKRPQLQERLTQDIGKYLVGVLHPKELWVGVTATHTCVMCRGAESSCSTTSSYHYKEDVQ